MIRLLSGDDDDDDHVEINQQDWESSHLLLGVLIPASVTVISILVLMAMRLVMPRVYEPRVWKAMPEIESVSRPLPKNPFSAFLRIVLRPLTGMGSAVGLDAVAFLASGRALLYLSAAFVVLSAPLLGPAYCWDDHWSDSMRGGHRDDLSLLGTCSILNVPDESERLIATIVTTYLFTFLAYAGILMNLFFVQKLKKDYQIQRRPWRHYTVLVQDIPDERREAHSIRYFFEQQGYTVESVVPVRPLGLEFYRLHCAYEKHWHNLRRFQDAQERAYKAGSLDPVQTRLPWPSCAKVDAVAYHQEECQNIRSQLEEYRAEYPDLEEHSSAFVTFKTLVEAAEVRSDLRFGNISKASGHWRVSAAPEPRDLNWFSMERGFSGVCFNLEGFVWMFMASALTIVCFMAPIAGIQILRTYEDEDPEEDTSLYRYWSWVPSLMLVIVNWLASYVLLGIVLLSGFYSHFQIQEAWMWMYFAHLMINGFLVTFVFSVIIVGTPSSGVTFDFFEHNDPVKFLGEAMPAASAFYFLFIFTQAFTALVPRLAFPRSLFRGIWHRAWRLSTWELDWAIRPNHAKYAKMYARDGFIFGINFAFGVVAPGVFLAGFTYFMLSHLTFKYKFLYQYRSQFQAEGSLSIPAARQVLAGMTVAHLIIFAVILVKRPEIAPWVIPLMPLTIILILVLPFLFRILNNQGLDADLAEEFDADPSDLQTDSKQCSLRGIRTEQWKQHPLRADLDKPCPDEYFWRDMPQEAWESDGSTNVSFQDSDEEEEAKEVTELLDDDEMSDGSALLHKDEKVYTNGHVGNGYAFLPMGLR